MKLEIAVTTLEGVLAAAEHGADRVELTTALEVGGLTPSQGLLEVARASASSLGIHALIRTRPGDFVYSPEDLSVMVREVESVLRAGADGVVIGALTESGHVDQAATRRLAEAAWSVNPDAEVTFHRAIDQSRDALQTLDVLLELGLTRVLTSGQAPRVGLGLDTLAALVARAAGSLQVMAGGGLLPTEIPALKSLGLDAVHLSAKKRISRSSGQGIAMGSSDGDDPNAYWGTDETAIAQANELRLKSH